MTPEQQAAFIMAQAACAIAEIAAMQAANQLAATTGNAIQPFRHDDFLSVQSRYTIGHNDVLSFFRGPR